MNCRSLERSSVEATLNLSVTEKSPIADGVVQFTFATMPAGPLPSWRPGAHIDLTVREGVVRQYSLCGDPRDRTTYRVAVLREDAGRGGSVHLHDEVTVGDRISVRGPRNHFALVDARRYLFIAGGIGITPILPMVSAVARSGRPWTLFYGGRTRSSMAFRDELKELDAQSVRIQPSDEVGLLDLSAAMGATEPGTAIYCCGPEGLLTEVERRCSERSLGNALHLERFTARGRSGNVANREFDVVLARSGQVLHVDPTESILDVLEAAGISVLSSCREGTCGTCETAVLDGEPEHRDSVLTDAERASNETLMVCVSRCSGERIVLDL